jgi:hypothetical protein
MTYKVRAKARPRDRRSRLYERHGEAVVIAIDYMGWILPGLAAVVALTGWVSAFSASAKDRIYDPAGGELRVVQGTVGMRGLQPDQVYQFQPTPAKRVLISEPPCGKPYMVTLPNGDLLVTYARNYAAAPPDPARPMHNEVRWSSDGGLTWSDPVVPFPVDGIGANYEGNLLVLPDGRLLISTIALQGSQRPGPYLSVSADNGRTWSPSWKLDLAMAWDDGHGWPNRQNIANPDGSVVLMCNNFFRDPKWRCVAFQLDPDLHTITDHWDIVEQCADQSFLLLKSGQWFGVWRVYGLRLPRNELPYGYVPQWDDGNEGHDFLAATQSSDGGRTWSKPRPVTGYMEVPGHVMELHDGRLLLTYGVRHYPMGAQAVLSNDGGKTWDLDNRFMLAWHGALCWNSAHPYPNGHPYSTQRQDGKIVTAYYRTADPNDCRSTLVEAVIWDLPPVAATIVKDQI